MRKCIFLFFLGLAIFLLGQNIFAFKPGKIFYVAFDSMPDLKDNKVYAKGYPIGKILDKELSEDLKVIITIRIYPKYTASITKGGVFYADNGKLNYDILEKDTKQPLPSESILLGFSSKKEFYLFKAQYHVQKLAEEARKRAEELYKEIKEK